ncbi:MAG: ferredoxin--NADP reductase [Pseudomonadota bacterium]
MPDASAAPAAPQLPKSVTGETVLSVKHWTDRLFELRVTRPPALRFRSGEFVMIGLMNGPKPLLRAYSIASPAWDEALDFYSIKVADGPLTSKLQHVTEGSDILLGKKPTGTLVLDALKPGRRLFLFSTGTGFAPFSSLLREPETYEKFEQVVITHTCREVAELAYGRSLVGNLKSDPLVGEVAPGRVTYYPSVTREDYFCTGRITTLIETGQLFRDLGAPEFDLETDRAMICGSMEMIADTKALLEHAGFTEGSNAAPGDFVVEKAFSG